MSKILELKSVIGQECSYNGSPTNRAKLIRVDGERCVLKVVSSPYGERCTDKWAIDNERVGELISGYTPYVWNAFFY